FSEPGGRIEVRSRNDGKRIVVEVRDHGMGIDAETMPRIFEAFEQGEGSAALRLGGLGLGLAIARGLIESHGGTIVAESDGQGQGARFRISLDVAAEETAAKSAKRPEAAAGKGPETLRILLVEDHQDTGTALV